MFISVLISVLIIVAVLIVAVILYYRKSNRIIASQLDLGLDSLSTEALESELRTCRKIVADTSKSYTARRKSEDLIKIIEQKIAERQA